MAKRPQLVHNEKGGVVMDEPVHPFVSADLEELLKKAFQEKIWSECTEGFDRLTTEEKYEIESMCETISETYGEDSQEMYDFFEQQSMRFSTTYYFVYALNLSDRDHWDEAFAKELA